MNAEHVSEPRCLASDATLAQVRELYTALATHPERDFGWGKGKENARALGYHPRWLERWPESLWASAAAVGNPFLPGEPAAGATVLDLGCGAGIDLCIAATLVGPAGRAIGVDVTPAMVDKARACARAAMLGNVEVLLDDMASVTLAGATVDLVISNGAINLALDKAPVFAEILRVLRPGGRLQFADMVREAACESASTCPPADACAAPSAAAWADCVAGTLTGAAVLDQLRNAGFVECTLLAHTGYRTSSTTQGAVFVARKPD